MNLNISVCHRIPIASLQDLNYLLYFFYLYFVPDGTQVNSNLCLLSVAFYLLKNILKINSPIHEDFCPC